MVFGNLSQHITAKPIHATIANMAEKHKIAGYEQRNHRRAHSMLTGILRRGFKDSQIRKLDTCSKTVFLETKTFFHLVRPRNIFVLRSIAKKAFHGLYSQRRSYFAARVTTHA